MHRRGFRGRGEVPAVQDPGHPAGADTGRKPRGRIHSRKSYVHPDWLRAFWAVSCCFPACDRPDFGGIVSQVQHFAGLSMPDMIDFLATSITAVELDRYYRAAFPSEPWEIKAKKVQESAEAQKQGGNQGSNPGPEPESECSLFRQLPDESKVRRLVSAIDHDADGLMDPDEVRFLLAKLHGVSEVRFSLLNQGSVPNLHATLDSPLTLAGGRYSKIL